MRYIRVGRNIYLTVILYRVVSNMLTPQIAHSPYEYQPTVALNRKSTHPCKVYELTFLYEHF